jgi:hypothetical protein
MRDLLAQCAPPEPTREDRIRLLLAVAVALRAGDPVPVGTGRILGDALLDWLCTGGNLGRRLGVAKRGSHYTVHSIVAKLKVDVADQDSGNSEVFTMKVRSSNDDDIGTKSKDS